MIGIYKITNLENDKCYVGQSKNLEKRKYQHFHSRGSKLDKEIHENPDNFVFEILEECPEEKLTERETFYIEQNCSAKTGYNCAIGGNSRPGTANSNSKLNLLDVINIRQSYNNHENKKEVFNKYKDKIQWRGFEKVWFGETWTNVMMDVYTEENKYYYSHDTKSNPQETIYSDKEVLEYRKRYVNESGREIYNSINGQERSTYHTFEAALIGMTHKDIPIYKKKDKKWI